MAAPPRIEHRRVFEHAHRPFDGIERRTAAHKRVTPGVRGISARRDSRFEHPRRELPRPRPAVHHHRRRDLCQPYASAHSGDDAFMNRSIMVIDATSRPPGSRISVSYQTYSVFGVAPVASTVPETS